MKASNHDLFSSIKDFSDSFQHGKNKDVSKFGVSKAIDKMTKDDHTSGKRISDRTIGDIE